MARAEHKIKRTRKRAYIEYQREARDETKKEGGSYGSPRPPVT